MNATVMCEKCGKPLGVFDGNICNECETERSRQMPHSLRAKLSGLRYKGLLEDKDYKRLCEALDKENVLKQIREEISKQWYTYPKNKYEEGLKDQALEDMQIIDKYRG